MGTTSTTGTTGRTGRPTKLNNAVTERLVAAIKTGATLRHACGWAGIGYTTYKQWMRWGEQATRGRYRAFRATVQQAIAESALWRLANVKEQARDDWRASAWVLEHRFPRDYGNRAHIEMAHSGQMAVTVEEVTAARTAVLVALSDYPQARLAVAARLAELDAQQQQRQQQERKEQLSSDTAAADDDDDEHDEVS